MQATTMRGYREDMPNQTVKEVLLKLDSCKCKYKSLIKEKVSNTFVKKSDMRNIRKYSSFTTR